MTRNECPPSARVGALVITYFPDYRKLACLLSALRNSVENILVFSNGANTLEHKAFVQGYENYPDVVFYEAADNLGVARALNQGISYFEKAGYSYCWTFDQDSLPEKDALNQLVAAVTAKNIATGSIAAVVPTVLNRWAGGPIPFLVEDSNGQIAAKKLDNSGVVMAAITSGMLVDISAWKRIGGMLENFFIDHVDTEWCFRASAKGFKILAVPKATIQHELGSPSEGIPYFRDRPLTLRSPIRTYYMLRNGWAIAIMTNAPRDWKRYNNIQSLKIILIAVFFGPCRMKQIAAMFRARRDVDKVLA